MASIPPATTIQTESTVLAVPIDKCWKSFREFKLEQVAPEYVTSTETISGSGLASVIKVTYENGGVWHCRITELSDRNYTVAYEVVETEPAMTCTSVEGEIVLQKVSDGDETFLKWTTVFSNDADAGVMADQKYKKLDFFKAFKKSFS
jgi:hypothetical protein